MGIIQTIEGDATALWTTIEKVWNTDVAPALATGEQELVQLLQPMFGQVEAAALQDLVVFIKGVVSAAPTTKTLPEWESVILNLAQTFGGSLMTTATGLGSNVLQAVIGLVLAWVEQAAAKAAGQTTPAS
jgi:hypothetical protein